MDSQSTTPRVPRVHSRRALLQRVAYLTIGSAAVSVLEACGPAAAPAANTPAATSAPSKPTAAPGPTSVATVASAPAPAAPTTAPAAVSSSAPTGTLRYASADFSNETMDPIVLATQWGWALYDSLLMPDAHGNMVGNIAETYSLSPDGLTWTFNIRKGVKFHNGDPLTADDVVFSLQHFGSKDSTNPWSPYILRNSESITATDDHTVVYKAHKPEWPLKVPFAQTLILPKNYFQQVGQDGFQAKPVGSGPYRFGT